MKLILTGKNLTLTDDLKTLAEKKLSKLDKYFADEVEARAVFSHIKNRNRIEVTVFLKGATLRAEETSDDMETSMDKVVDVLSRQVRKYKTRLKNKSQHKETIRFENFEEPKEEPKEKIVKRKRFKIHPMFEEEAVVQMELLNHDFFVYINEKDGTPAVIYRRDDGDYGIIETEN